MRRIQAGGFQFFMKTSPDDHQKLMKKILSLRAIRILTLLACVAGPDHASSQATKKIVIAHRGASGYVPEHTLAAKAMAHAMGADYIEQDLVMTKDNRIVVLHDHHLDRVTNVQEMFPKRHRKDGRFYAIDFTLEEIRRLLVVERFKIIEGKKVAVYPHRFPLKKSRFKVHTFEEEIELIQGMNKSTGRNVGIYPEIKHPQFHLGEGKDISKAIVRVLKKYGYTKKTDAVYLQVFIFDEVKRLRDVLLPELEMDLKLVFLVSGSRQYNWINEKGGMEKVAKYADGLGPNLSMIVSNKSNPGVPEISNLVRNAHRAGLVVHPYTFRIEKNAIPKYAKNFNELQEIFFHKANIDGVFTDFPDRVVKFLHR
jgi:glycerophosphoryl diester phosphodiesterase